MRLISDGKVRALKESLEKAGAQASVFVSSEPVLDSNIAYLTGFSGMMEGALMINDSGLHLLASTLDHDRALEQAQVDEIIRIGARKEFMKTVSSLLPGTGKVGIVRDRISVGSMRRLRIPLSRAIDIGPAVADARSVKEPRELGAIEKCARIANRGISFLRDSLRTGMAESEVAAALEKELNERGSEGTPFGTIVTNGRRSWQVHPHPPAGRGKIGTGLGIVDFGAVYKGYVTDVTVPFAVGKLTGRQRSMMNAVDEAVSDVKAIARDGLELKALDGSYRKGITRSGFEVKHSLGHGIGIDAHERPSIGTAGKLSENMVVALEPGVYSRGDGGFRLENDFVVKRKGCVKLTKSSLIRL